MNEKTKLYLMIILSIIPVMAFTGWVMNFYKLFHLDFKQPYKAEIIRTIGVVPPIGAVIGWMDIND